ncbi:MAG: ABC transporter ATP-binding protein [Muribaculaceae bacterium]|nr:ABC transporter ATP-binding protein [Muribaculaceae bacterium]
MAILTTHSLSVGFKNGKATTTLLSELNLSLEQGTLTALLGRNGAGKSTLLRAIGGSERPLSGCVKINGDDLHNMSFAQAARLIALVTTERVSVGALTVRELVELGRQPHTGFLGKLSAQDREAVEQAMENTGIKDMAGKMMSQLSDGERQKVMIARALAQETPVIILDEPTAFLDVANRIETMQLLGELAHAQDKAVLLSSHDISQSLRLADRLWLVTDNRSIICDSPQKILSNNEMDRIFNSDHIRFNPTLLDFDYKS